MATSVTDPAALVDLGACGWCQHVQWSHKRGKSGCKELGCPCGKYEPPKDRPAPAAVLEVDPSSEVPGKLVDGPEVPGPLERVGGFEPAQPGDVDLPMASPGTAHRNCGDDCGHCNLFPAPVVSDPVAQAEHAVQVAAIDAQLADPEPTDDEVADEIDRAEDAAQIERLTAQLEQVRADKIRLAGKLDDVRDENRRLREALTRAEGHHATALEALRKTADAYVQTGVAAAARVLYRYDADQCTTEGCGSRYTVPVEHPHPLTPVTVLVVRREVPGAA